MASESSAKSCPSAPLTGAALFSGEQRSPSREWGQAEAGGVWAGHQEEDFHHEGGHTLGQELKRRLDCAPSLILRIFGWACVEPGLGLDDPLKSGLKLGARLTLK